MFRRIVLASIAAIVMSGFVACSSTKESAPASSGTSASTAQATYACAACGKVEKPAASGPAPAC